MSLSGLRAVVTRLNLDAEREQLQERCTQFEATGLASAHGVERKSCNGQKDYADDNDSQHDATLLALIARRL